jgi:multisubunit Na+/H+ antiporter MnhB subunit
VRLRRTKSLVFVLTASLLVAVGSFVLLDLWSRLETPDGEFDGMVVCVVTPGLLKEFFRTMEIGKRGIIWVFHPNVSAYRSLDTPHLIIGVSLERDEILADWRVQRCATALGFGILTIILGGMLMLVSGQIDARSKVEHDETAVGSGSC